MATLGGGASGSDFLLWTGGSGRLVRSRGADSWPPLHSVALSITAIREQRDPEVSVSERSKTSVWMRVTEKAE